MRLASAAGFGGIDVIEEEGIEFHKADAAQKGEEPNVIISNLHHITRAGIFGLSIAGKLLSRDGSTVDMVADAGLDSEVVLLEKTIRDGIKGAFAAQAQGKKNPRMKLIEQQRKIQNQPPTPNITIHTL